MQWNFSCAALNRKNRFDIVEIIKFVRVPRAKHAAVLFEVLGDESSDPA